MYMAHNKGRFIFPVISHLGANGKMQCLYIDALGRPTVVIIVFAHVVRSYVRPSTLFKTKQISSENNVHYWRDSGSGRVDHW